VIPFALALFATLSPAPNPLPEGKSIDGFSFRFQSSLPGFGPVGDFSVMPDGKVHYSHATEAHTGSGGTITQAKWEIPKAEAEALFRALVGDGLLELPDAKGLGGARFQFWVYTGRWQAALAADPLPEKILARLRPYLEKAHPGLWKRAEPPGGGPKPVLTSVRYEFAEKIFGPGTALAVTRTGAVTYTRTTRPAGGAPKVLVDEAWSIPGADAAELLDALIGDGVLDLPDTLGGKFPNHYVEAHAGKWRSSLHPKEMPDAVMKHLRPLLEKADPDIWKKP